VILLKAWKTRLTSVALRGPITGEVPRGCQAGDETFPSRSEPSYLKSEEAVYLTDRTVLAKVAANMNVRYDLRASTGGHRRQLNCGSD
jgi:hypothetical protein